MSHKAELKAAILRNVQEILPMLEQQEKDIEAARRLPDAVVQSLKNTGVFSMAMPESLGGAELDPIAQIEIIETLSRASAAAGWCTMIGSDSGYFSAFLAPDLAREMYPSADTITAAAISQTGKARRVPGGYRVSGRWPFSSGCQQSEWLVAGCKVYDGDTMARLEGTNIPETLQVFFHKSDVNILDTWNSLGLRGSGSHDFVAEDVFIPEEKSFSFQRPVSHQPGALYRFPLAFMFNFAAVPLGVAARAIDLLSQAASAPTRQVTQAGVFLEDKCLKDEGFVQDALGRAQTKLKAARAFYHSEVSDIWEQITLGQPLDGLTQTGFLAMNTEVFGMCEDIVEMLAKVRGGSVVYHGNPFEQALRDVITINQHVMTSWRNYSQVGRVLLGVPPEEILL